jgi:hypothetical protein
MRWVLGSGAQSTVPILRPGAATPHASRPRCHHAGSGYGRFMVTTRRLLTLVAAGALIALPGCSTDDAVQKDAKNAAPTVEQAAKDAKKAGGQAVDAVDDNDSK